MEAVTIKTNKHGKYNSKGRYENPKSRGGQIMNGSVLLQLFPIFQSIDHGYCTYSNLVVYIY